MITAASDRHLSACKQLGLRVLRIGDEAVVDPRTFSLEGRADPEGAAVDRPRQASRLAG